MTTPIPFMILIVDDRIENIYSLKLLLESRNFQVDTALSGQEALKKVLKNDYSLIILDVQMPGMDGFEVAEALSGYSKTRDVPIIFLTAANTEKKFIARGYDSGGMDYIVKPFDPDILFLKIKNFYRLHEQNVERDKIKNNLKQEIKVRKKEQENLKLQLDYIHTILECLPQIAFTTDTDGAINFVNNNWFRFSDSKGKLPEIHPDDYYLMSKWDEARLNGKSFEAELRIKDVNIGEFRYHLVRVVPLRDNGEVRKWVGTFTDIHAHKVAESKKDEFLSIASHELKTPLTSVKAYIQLLARMVASSGNDTIIQYVDNAHGQVLKLENLISELLDLSKIENGKLKMNKQFIDLDALIDSTIRTIYTTHQRPDIQILREGDKITEPVFADENRIEQVLINFLNNAIKYSPDSDTIIVRSALDDGIVTIGVQDFGIGIPEEKQKHIFTKFYRVEESSVKFQGLGIGLYICGEIIRQHHGTYGLISKAGQGTTVHFSIPVN